ncbi:MAG TPA: hypothetical protein VLT36_08995 [Candidatus Dormibacteraeota bacterium]|nr:hypothetical protein [Candidatus Dormibacteraeota bacterium]
MSNWFDTAFEKIDQSLAHLGRRCPKCGGALHRRFSLLDKLGLFLPIPHTIYAHHQCELCKTKFRSYRNLTDVLLEASWVGACAYLGDFKLFALVCPLTWLICSGMGKNNWSQGTDTIMAAVLTGILWLLALVFGGDSKHSYLMEHNVVMFLATFLFVIAPIWVVLVLDKYTTFGLAEEEDDYRSNGMRHV